MTLLVCAVTSLVVGFVGGVLGTRYMIHAFLDALIEAARNKEQS